MKRNYGDEKITQAKQLRDGLTAEQHIQRAEKLLAGRLGGDSASDWWDQPTTDDIVLAQVHATLAQARAAIEARAEIRPAVPR